MSLRVGAGICGYGVNYVAGRPGRPKPAWKLAVGLSRAPEGPTHSRWNYGSGGGVATAAHNQERHVTSFMRRHNTLQPLRIEGSVILATCAEMQVQHGDSEFQLSRAITGKIYLMGQMLADGGNFSETRNGLRKLQRGEWCCVGGVVVKGEALSGGGYGNGRDGTLPGTSRNFGRP